MKLCIEISGSAKNDSDNFSNAEITKNALASMPISTAKQTLIDFQKESNAPAIPLSVIRAMYSILPASDLVKLDRAIGNNSSSLIFTDPPADTEDTPEARRFKKRMDRLRMQAEEKRYHKLTSNLDHVVDDDVTTKSMTYAASVGLNMIVAPISFGVFMYFFAAQIFSWVAGGDAEEGAYAKDKVDIKGVIAGVISGVFMLVVEMLLFVIRSHTFDKEITKKKKKKTLSPFGYSKPDAGTEETNAKEPTKNKQDTSIAAVDKKTKKEA